MEAIKMIKLELIGEAHSFRSLDGQSKICNWLYNHLLEKAQVLKRQFIETGDQEAARTVYTERGLRDQLPNWLKLYDKRIDELKSKRDRCLKKSKNITIADAQGNPLKEKQIPSKRWHKYQQALEKARHKRQEQTKTFVYTLAHQICKTYDAIGIGDYTPKGKGLTALMRRAMNNRSLIGRFKQALEWVAKKIRKNMSRI